MELWDLLDENGIPLGKTHVRGEPLPPGTYHRVVEIFTVNSRGELLITLRAPDKVPFPNMWEVTGGSVVAGEDSLTAAKRELQEETGLSVSDDEIRLLHSHRGNTAWVDIYLVRKDAAIDDLTLQEGETTAARWIDFTKWERMIETGELPEPIVRRYGPIRESLRDIMSGQ